MSRNRPATIHRSGQRLQANTSIRNVGAVFLFLLTSTALMPRSAGAQTVTRGPYLNIGMPTGVTVRWRTDIATDSRVSFGTAPGILTAIADDGAVTTEHVVEVSGLSPDTKYFYSIGTTTAVLAGNDLSHYFRTSPAPGTKTRTLVWVIGDSGQPGLGQDRVYNAYVTRTGTAPTDVWLMLGDNAYTLGTDAQYQLAVFDPYAALLRNTVVWPTRGNHDALHAGANNDYYEIFSLPDSAQAGGVLSGCEEYYSFDYGNIHFVCLDSQGSDRSPGGDMLTWLVSDLADTAADSTLEWTIAYWHHPAYTRAGHDSDSVTDSGGRMVQMRMNALPILEAGGVDLVLTGHSHSYERSFLIDGHYGHSSTLHDSMVVDGDDGNLFGDGAYLKPAFDQSANDGAVHAVAGSSSKLTTGALNHPVMVRSFYELGSMVLEINGNQLDAIFINDDGDVLDSFTIIKGITATSVSDRTPGAALALNPAFPNPFSGNTRLGYTISSPGHVRLTIYDVKGRRIRRLIAEHREPGSHVIVWDGQNAHGKRVAPSVYFSVLEFGDEKRARKLVLIK